MQIKRSMRHAALALGAAAVLAGCASVQYSPMSFFVTSVNPGKGADLGGLAGADAHCQALAAAAGAGGRTWHAYLSTTAQDGRPAVNARDRIGTGPWRNANGVVIASSVAELHGTNNISKATALTERGQPVRTRGDAVNEHDMLTGSTPDGRAFPAGPDRTCHNWTSSSEGSAIVGHVDRTGTNPDPVANASWNSSHATPGCSPDALRKVGGGGLMYCFAVD